MMTDDDVRQAAEREGWSLSEGELEKVLKGAHRNQRLLDSLQKYVAPETEPAPTFKAS